MTDAQARVLEAVRRASAGGWPASVRDIGREAGLASPSTTQQHLAKLEEAGLVETNPTRRRGWRLTPAGAQQPTTGLS